MYVLTDFSVFCHLLHSKYLKHSPSDDLLEQWVCHQVCLFMGGGWLGPLREDDLDFIWLLDGKPYWRHQYLEQLGATYKGGRRESPDSFLKIYSALANLLQSRGYRLWKVTGYEADDLAATFVMQSGDRKCLLATVDKDWKGLIRENVSWFSLRQYKPEFRYCHSLDCMNKWLVTTKMGVVESPHELWQRLSEFGDSSDGLPKGGPLEVIDLLNPPQEYRLWEKMTASWETGKPVSTIHQQISREWLEENGFVDGDGFADTVIQPFRKAKDDTSNL